MSATTTHDRSHADAADVLLLDGTVGSVRRLEETDRESLVGLHDGLGDDALRLRFFGVSREFPHRYVEHVLEGIASDTVVALGLWQQGRLLGVATAETDGARREEVAFVVADDQ